MDWNQYITITAERKKGQHLQREERGAIQQLKRLGFSDRAVARALGCSPSTVGNELRRGTRPRKSNKGNVPRILSKARRGRLQGQQEPFQEAPQDAQHCTGFLEWARKQIRIHKWSLDACVGYARLHGLYSSDERVCTRTLYNEVWAGNLSLSLTDLPEALKRKCHKASAVRENKKKYGNGISERPEIAALRVEGGHWEGDTVVGKRAGKEAVIFSLLEKKTENYIPLRIPGKDSDSVLSAMQQLKDERADRFSEVFKTITVDKGSEFSAFAQVENWGSKVYFAHPYTSWERPQNERHNGLFRAFVPKGVSIEEYSPEDILNGRPRKKLGYRTAEELYEEFLDSVYAVPAS